MRSLGDGLKGVTIVKYLDKVLTLGLGGIMTT